MFVVLHIVCRKARTLVFAMCTWQLSSIFDLGLCGFDRPIRIQHFTPCARVVDKQSLGTRLAADNQIKRRELLLLQNYPKRDYKLINSFAKRG